MLDFVPGMGFPCTMRSLGTALSFATIVLASHAHAVELSAADRTAVFTAAGFKERGGKWIRCEEDPPTASYVAGNIEVVDLNGDGRPEAWVKESSSFCYGNTAELTVLVTKDADGRWRKLIDQVGVALVLRRSTTAGPTSRWAGPA